MPAMLGIVTVGLPASGKSTYARRWTKRGFVEVNRDAIRRRYFGGRFGVPQIEAAVTRIAREQIADAARAGCGVIVSDTHVTRRSRKAITRLLRGLGYDRVEAHVFDVGPAVCLARNRTRPDRVPESVIRDMADRLRRQPPRLSDGFDAIVRIVAGPEEPELAGPEDAKAPTRN